jgi:hypothetical protein
MEVNFHQTPLIGVTWDPFLSSIINLPVMQFCALSGLIVVPAGCQRVSASFCTWDQHWVPNSATPEQGEPSVHKPGRINHQWFIPGEAIP